MSSLSTGSGDSSSIALTSMGDLDITSLSAGGAGNVSLQAAGDINYTTLSLDRGGATLQAQGSIQGGNISQAGSASLTAEGGAISIQSIDGTWTAPATGAIQLTAFGDVNLSGELASTAGVSVTSTNGSIYGNSSNTFRPHTVVDSERARRCRVWIQRLGVVLGAEWLYNDSPGTAPVLSHCQSHPVDRGPGIACGGEGHYIDRRW